jgi:uncharacterized protein YjdB
MSRSGRTLATVVAVALSSWSCGSTSPDGTPEVASIVVTPATSTVVLNTQLPLQAQVRDGSGAAVPDAAVTWTVQDPKILSVSASGVVTGLALGTSQVAANALGKSGLAVITVTKVPVASVVLLPNRVDFVVGTTYQLSASVLDANGITLTDRAIAWTTSNPGIATVNGSGIIAGVATGTTTITAASEGRSGTSTVTVLPEPVVRVDVNPATLTLQAGQTQLLVALPKDAKGNLVAGQTVVWSSDKVAVASVSGGLVTTSKTGVATITASVGSVKGTATITVNPGPVETVTVSAPSQSLNVRSTMQLDATAKDAQGNIVPNQTFYWASSNSAIATVSATGVVTGKRSGTVTIIAQTLPSGGTSGSVQIDVN